MAHFAFSPSTELNHKIEQLIQQRYQTDALYPLRNEVTLALNNELVDALLTGFIEGLNDEQRQMAEKVAHTVKSTIHVLLNQLLVKAENTTVNKSIDFLIHCQFAQTPRKIGMPLSDEFVEQMQSFYQAILNQQQIDKKALTQHYKLFTHHIIQYFMVDFNKTLDLGFIKQKTVDLSANAVSKTVDLALDKLIVRLSQKELEHLAQYHGQFFFK